MSKSYKLKENNYIDSSGIIHNRKNLKNVLNSINSTIIYKPREELGLSDKAGETILLDFNIAEPGRYLFFSKIPLNYYGQEGRELYLYLRRNGIGEDVAGGVFNTYAWTHYEILFAICDVTANSKIEVVVANNGGKKFHIGWFSLKYMKLNI